ncbi:PepSY domain-containing protein [Shewanella abyssi]|uniref:PepSY domain-containing protein n=1 Tax=Shewanella abyssi TaxID=311789 RepID=UPI0020100AA7|nr:PepSY domain-containing protein [Shewanella abyssi]MCL1048549.1 PepSY domain-containing protein [Shewanella abyssi]
MKAILLLILIPLLMLGSLPAYAGGHYASISIASMAMATNNRAKSLKVSSPQQAAQLVKRKYPGKILNVKSARVNGNPGYRIKLLSKDGVVFYVNVDAKTGSVRRN